VRQAGPPAPRTAKPLRCGTASALPLTELSNSTILVLQPYKIDRLCEPNTSTGTLAAVNGLLLPPGTRNDSVDSFCMRHIPGRP
jgi:hypothetical protein